jgi:hypothetical protein
MMRFTWRYLRAGATADRKILRDGGNISSIIPGNTPSIMAYEPLPATID